jgi:DNA-binding NarL/FixJ family response regulator
VSSPTRVFHCDDSSAFRVLVREMLHDLGGVELVGEAATLQEAMDRIPPAHPDVLLVDLFERERAADLLAALRDAAPGARILIYTGMPADHVPDGADGHVHKSVPFETLHQAITQVVARST